MKYVSIDLLWNEMSEANQKKALADLPDIKGLFCYVFPYFAGKREGNISLYARGKDYHKVISAKLAAECEKLKAEYPDNIFLPYVDISPFPEVMAAAMAGLGKKGKHGLLITEKYGSFVFVGVIATNLEMQGGKPAEVCRGCNACIKACPNRALSERGFDERRCLSAITQRKGELTDEEKALMRSCNSVWGCDACQLACPENAKVMQTHIDEFKEDLIDYLTSQDLQDSNKKLQKKYADRAFIWRGAAVLKRNTEILEEE